MTNKNINYYAIIIYLVIMLVYNNIHIKNGNNNKIEYN